VGEERCKMSKRYRIAICGSHGTGKTTLAKELSKRLGLPMIEEVARTVIKSAGYQSTREYIEQADKSEKERIQMDIFELQRKRETDFAERGFVSDRSVFDAVAYAWEYEIDMRVVYNMLGRAISHALNEYDLLVYVPIMFGVEDDGFRDTRDYLRRCIDSLLCDFTCAYETLGGRALRIKFESLEDRVKEVMEEVEYLAKLPL